VEVDGGGKNGHSLDKKPWWLSVIIAL